MSKRFDRIFIIDDGKTSRRACFEIPNAKTGLELVAYFKDELGVAETTGLADIAVKHLILLPDVKANKEEMRFNSIEELEYVFDDVFIGLKLIMEFQTDIAPLLKRLTKSLPTSSGTQGQGNGK